MSKVKQNVVRSKRMIPTRRRKFIENLHRQAKLPVYSGTLKDKLFRFFVLGLGDWGLFCHIICLVTSVLWFLTAMRDWNYYVSGTGRSASFLNIWVIATALLVLVNITVEQRFEAYAMTKYPYRTVEIYRETLHSGRLIQGQVIDVRYEKRTIEIDYSFTLPLEGEKFTGQYVTTETKPVNIGDEVTVLYLDRDVYVLLFSKHSFTTGHF